MLEVSVAILSCHDRGSLGLNLGATHDPTSKVVSGSRAKVFTWKKLPRFYLAP